MNILITGANGFIGRNLHKRLKENNNVFHTSRDNLNILDKPKIDEFFKISNIDVVIHTAVSGGRRTKIDTVQCLIENLIMFDNLARNKERFKNLIHFGSGAEFDRRYDIVQAQEQQDSSPIDYYGLSKKIIKREIDNIDSFYNFRIFGCFGKDEDRTRFIRSAIHSARSGRPIIVHQDRYMDFISIEDVCTVVEYYLENLSDKNLPRDVNLCYNKKMSLLDIATKINKIFGQKLENVIVENNNYDKEYTGSASVLDELDVSLLGLDYCLARCADVRES